MRQDLVDPAARHHIAAEKQAHAGVKRRVIGFVHRIAARAAGARAPPIPIKLFGAATGARRAGTAHDVASARIGIPARSGSARAARVGDAAEPPAGSLRRGAGRAPSDTRGGCDRGGGRGRAPHLLGAIRARSEPDPSPIRARSGRDPGAPRPSILIQACAARIAKAGDDRDPFFPSTKAVAYRYLARIGALQASRARPRDH
ncbi:hypothetical protein [Burkholderia pseudomallei]|uniref:hypothetical protein n=1 Tax=Burkholderia pseudomallei TaxID=28450 RepID=UPI0018A6C1A7|nr:hypothetical protein [Burkholderia pseudomallei]